MRATTWFLLVVSVLAFAGLGLSGAQAAEQGQAPAQAQGQDQWRYLFHNGEWWYWMPQGRWVYWRDNHWNNYDPRTFTYDYPTLTARDCPVGVAPGSSVGSTYGSRAAPASDVRPFYGHAISNLDRRPLEIDNETGPFYGHALPSEVFGGWRDRQSSRPFYGHAVSSSGN
jgi:hypothetical protein